LDFQQETTMEHSQDSGYASQDQSQIPENYQEPPSPRPPTPGSGPEPSSSQDKLNSESTTTYKKCSQEALLPEFDTQNNFFIQVENISKSFPPNSYVIKWVRSDSNWYANILITKNEARNDILKSVESFFDIASNLDAYLVNRSGLCLCPKIKNGPEINRSLLLSNE